MSHNSNNDELIKNALRQGDGLVENVFNSIKSQHELNTCNDGKRSSDVVLSAVEKCERLQKQLDIAVKCLKTAVDLACPYFPVKTAKADSFHQLKNIQKKCGIALQQIEELK